jgi:probable rRNA maturation factor
MMISIEIANKQNALELDFERLRQAAEAVLRDARIVGGTLSIAVVDDGVIHELNRQYLEHDEPTDVLSFVLESTGGRLDGEVIVSSTTAMRVATEYGWSPADELLLYVIHGTLHLVGYDDADAASCEAMRGAERRYLALFGLQPRA